MRRGILVAILLILASCTQVADQGTIKVGVIAPLTGPVARFGGYLKEGFDLAIDEVNANGGINGKQIRLLYEDTKCPELTETTVALKKLKEIDEVVAALGPFCGSENMVAGQFSTDNDMFIISPGDNFGNTGEFKVNTRYLLKKEAELMADYSIKQNWKKVGILFYDNDWGQGYKNAIKDYLEAKGGELIIAESYTFASLDVRTQLLKIKEANPDAVVIIDATSGELFQQVREAGINVPLFSEWEIEKPETQGVAGPTIEGVYYFMPGGKETEFHKNFEEKYGKKPDVINTDSYDAAKILAEALSNCDPNYTPQCMLDYVTSLKDYQGGAGPLTFNKESWAFDKPFILKTVKDGKYVEVKE